LLTKETVPLERAKLKLVVGQRRTTAETIALTRERLAQGRSLYAVADELVSSNRPDDLARVERYARYLRNLLNQATQAEKPPRNPSVHAGEMALTPKSDTGAPPRLRYVPLRPCPGCGIDYMDAFRFNEHLDSNGQCKGDRVA
jgi:hypothetical protein